MAKRKCAVAALTAVALVSVSTTALAKGGDDLVVEGTCTRASSAELKVGREDAGLELEFEVDQNRVGVRWNVVLRQNGKVVLRTTKLTRAPSGSFTARRLVPDRAGVDRIVATATRPGETCTARASFRVGV